MSVSKRLGLLLLITVIGALGAACGGGGGDATMMTVPDGYPYPVQTPTLINDRSHLAQGVVYDKYTSDPPTSGPHLFVPANWGISDLALPKEQPVHNMEHGGVVIWYNCNASVPASPPAAASGPLSTDDCATLRNSLSAIVAPAAQAGHHIVMTPYASMDSRIGLTAWGYLDKFNTFDQARVTMFINTFECKFDPEHFCG
ncbi:MAG: DUF3105 domain-containing protein [Chloroflexota bacterium]